MRKIIAPLSLTLILGCQQEPKRSEELTGRLDTYMRAKTEFDNFNGAVLVAVNDSIVLHEGYGIADREWDMPNTSDTKFRIGSNTKQFTAACILQLVEQGKLSLDDTLGKYFSGFEYGDTVTVHMLLTHSSGLQDYFSFPEFDLRPVVISNDSMVHLLRGKLYNFLPGCDIGYSNSGYYLLGLIVEKVSGQSLEEYMDQHLLQVAGMGNTGVDRYDTILMKRAKGYAGASTSPMNAFDHNYTWGLMFAVGSMYSTVGDLYKWERALEGNTILSAASKEKMFFAHGPVIAHAKSKVDPANTMNERLDPIWYHLGYGTFVDTFMTHSRHFTRGYVAGFKSTIHHFANERTTVVVLQNNEENPDRIAEPLSAILFGAVVVAPYKREPVKVDPETLKKYVGGWSTVIAEEPWLFEITVHDGKIFRRIDDSPEMELIPESRTKFFYSDKQDKVFDFLLDADGHITGAWFIMNGLSYPLSKEA